MTHCVIPDHPRAVESEHGLMCGRHHDELRDWLTDLEQWWADWEAHRDEYHVTRDGQPRDSSIAVTDPRERGWREDPRDEPLSLAWARHANPLTGRLEDNGPDVPDVTQLIDSWSQVLAEECPGVTQPGSVVARVALLRHRLAWVAAQPWVDELWADVRAAQRAMAAALDESAGPVACGPCPYCGTLLHTRAELERWDARREQRTPREWDTERVQCAGCGKSWEGTGVVRLRLMQEAS